MLFRLIVLLATLLPPPPPVEPPVSLDDLRIFPPREVVRVHYHVVRSAHNHLQHCASMQVSTPSVVEARDAYASTFRAWDLLDDATRWGVPANDEWRDESSALEALTRLRKLLGYQAYYSGLMPSPAPSYLRRID